MESLFWHSARLVFKAVCPLGIFHPSFNMLPVIDYDNVKNTASDKASDPPAGCVML